MKSAILAKLYGIEIKLPGKDWKLYSVSMSKEDAEDYLKICQQATAPEHWRLVEHDIPEGGWHEASHSSDVGRII